MAPWFLEIRPPFFYPVRRGLWINLNAVASFQIINDANREEIIGLITLVNGNQFELIDCEEVQDFNECVAAISERTAEFIERSKPEPPQKATTSNDDDPDTPF